VIADVAEVERVRTRLQRGARPGRDGSRHHLAV